MANVSANPMFATAEDFIAVWNALGERGRPNDATMRSVIARAQVWHAPNLWSDLTETEETALLISARELGYLASNETAVGASTASTRPRPRIGGLSIRRKRR